MPVAGFDWSLFSLAAEARRIADLGVVFTEEGNAADDCCPSIRKPEDRGGERPLVREEWFEAMEGAENQQRSQMLAAAVERVKADLDRLEAASRKRSCRRWGEGWRYDPDVTLLEQPIPDYFGLLRWARLLVARGDLAARAGDPGTAREQYLAAFRVGHHMATEEPLLIAHAVGTEIKRIAARRLASFHQGRGDQELAEKWSHYVRWIESTGRTGEVYRRILDLPAEQVVALVENRDLPLSFRLEAILAHHYCIQNEFALLLCMATGTPQWVRDLEARFATESDWNRTVMEAIARDRPSRHAWDLLRLRGLLLATDK